MRVVAVGFALLVAAPPAAAQNLLPDPAFTSGVGGWTAVGASPATIQWLGFAGPDGSLGIARLQFSGPGSGFAHACVPVVGGRTYSWGGSFFPRSASAQIILDFFPNGSCLGVVVVGETFGPPAFTSGVWQFEPGPDVTAPPSAGSVLFRITATTGASETGVIDVDNVYFGPQGTPPPGVKDVPALSQSLVLVLSLALAIGGLLLLRPE